MHYPKDFVQDKLSDLYIVTVRTLDLKRSGFVLIMFCAFQYVHRTEC